MFFRRVLLGLLVLSSVSCYRVSSSLTPTMAPPPHPKEIQRETRTLAPLPDSFSVSPFAPLTDAEAATDWGKEYKLALAFAAEFDLYRAITGFKRALFLLPPETYAREQELHYAVALSYYLGKKYTEVVYLVQSTSLATVTADFPAFSDLLLMLYDSYTQLGQPACADHIFALITADSTESTKKLTLWRALQGADLSFLRQAGYEKMVSGYCHAAKSVRVAQTLNALLPGAGYGYVGLRQTAITAFLVNALFIGAATQLFLHDQGAAAAVVLSLEGGWYFGGIAGAGLAAKRYNEQLYSTYADKILQREAPFPCFLLKYTF